jgi:hypothetical protein
VATSPVTSSARQSFADGSRLTTRTGGHRARCLLVPDGWGGGGSTDRPTTHNRLRVDGAGCLGGAISLRSGGHHRRGVPSGIPPP